MGKLHELLAVEGDLGGTAARITEEAKVTFHKKADLFMGQVRTVTMLAEERQGENQTDVKERTTTVGDKLRYVRDTVVPYYDAVFQKELTNQGAMADLVMPDGEVIATDLPATFLLGLETKLKALRQMYEMLPTLQPGIKWVEDDNEGVGVYRQEHPAVNMKTEKTLQYKVMVDPTDKHPAQVEKWTADVPVGRIETVQTSGMISSGDKSEILGNIDVILQAVKRARQRANTAEVVERHVGRAIFDKIHDGLV